MNQKVLNRFFAPLMLCGLLLTTKHVEANPYQDKVNADITEFRAFFKAQFPDIKFEEFANGVYAIDADARQQWQEMEEFPPYALAVDEGKALFEKPFANKKTYADYFGNGGAVRQNYPYFDEKRNTVVTLEMAINDCRIANGEQPLSYKSQELAKISAYMAFISRGQAVNVKVESEGAYNAYLKGKEYFYSQRGKLNMSCSICHMQYAGRRLRSETPSPALGHPTHYPVFRSKWGEIGVLHRRYAQCSDNIGIKAQPYQSEAYRNFEFFTTTMANGLTFNGPASRK